MTVLVALLRLLCSGVVATATPAQAAEGNILPPFDIGETWNICQGYNNPNVTHTGTSAYGLDLTGAGCDNSASGRTVRAPMSGTVSYYQASYGNLCVNVAGGRSYTLTHINGSVTSGSVAAGQTVGTVAAAQPNLNAPPYNGNVAHIHFQMWDTANCYSSSGIPFDSAHGTRICGAPDLTANGPNGGNGTWSGTIITGAVCGVSSPPPPPDNDGDGTPDSSDQCPTVKGSIPSRGCPSKSDFNGDGKSDIFWYGPGDAPDTLWNGTTQMGVFGTGSVVANGFYEPFTGDFNGDGRADIFWYGPGVSTDGLWYGTSNAGVFDSGSSIAVQGTYIPLVGDFNGDGKSDIFWYGPGDAPDTLWSGTSTKGIFASSTVNVSGIYEPFSGDFNGDGKSDIFWYGPGVSTDGLWYGTSNAGVFDSGHPVGVQGVYDPVSGDFNGDGKSDVLWYGVGDDPDGLWYGTGAMGTFASSAAAVGGTYEPFTGDFNGDGRADIFWYGPGDATDGLWYGASTPGVFDSGHPAAVQGVYTSLR